MVNHHEIINHPSNKRCKHVKLGDITFKIYLNRNQTIKHEDKALSRRFHFGAHNN